MNGHLTRCRCVSTLWVRFYFNSYCRDDTSLGIETTRAGQSVHIHAAHQSELSNYSMFQTTLNPDFSEMVLFSR